ncbi:MAG TPA: replicative DNA helicase [Fimbriimonadaceae bacterium]|nr:replicative DNA helicase [Fimbriimonadaceae bacterium]
MTLATEELVPLHSLEMEMSTLGSMMLDDRAAEEVLAILDTDDFYRPAHRDIFRAIRQLVNSGKPPNLEFVIQELRDREVLDDIGGENYLIQVAEYVPSPSSATFYAREVQDKATMRRLERAGRDIVAVVHDADQGDADEKVDKAEQLVFEVGRRRMGTYFKHVSSLAKEFFVDVDHIMDSGEPMVGITSGFADLDKMTTGFYGGDMVIIGARPSMGKTALVLDFALAAAKEEKGAVAIFSLEMSGMQLVRRMVSMVSGVSGHALKSPSLSDDTYRKLADACEHLYSLPIHIDDASDINPLEMRGKCRRLKAEAGLSLVVVDYLQLMRGNKRTENRTQEISEIARGIKAMAKELQVPVIALSQLNRGVEAREEKRPVLSDIRESGSIEAEADIVMLLYRDAYYKAKEEREVDWDPEKVEEAEVIIAKHRNGPTGKVILGFQPSYARYRPLYHG